MTGQEHYRAAEDDIGLANRTNPEAVDDQRYFLARAQVHATLALAAAASENGDIDDPYGVES